MIKSEIKNGTERPIKKAIKIIITRIGTIITKNKNKLALITFYLIPHQDSFLFSFFCGFMCFFRDLRFIVRNVKLQSEGMHRSQMKR